MKWVERELVGFEPYLEMIKEKYQKELGFSEKMAEVLAKRDIDYDTVYQLLKAPGKCLTSADKIFGLLDVATEIKRLKGRKFHVFADYDVDGLTAGYIMTKYLERQGYQVSVYYPQRDEGYGLSEEFVKTHCECGDVIVTVDNGITANAAIKVADEIGVTVLITDHHERGDILPKCKICDPQLGDFGHNLCGAAVVLKLCQRLDELFETDFWWQYTPYAALGTVSDVMKMDTENMAIVMSGIKLMKNFAPNLWEMIQALGETNITTETLAWKVIPPLNACGRMGAIEIAHDFFFEADNTQKNILRILSLNEQRKKIQKAAIKDAMSKDYTTEAFCLFDATEYPVGIAGIIANKLSEEYQRPAIVYHRNKSNVWIGSVRSSTIDILSFLRELKKQGIIHSCAGHSHACAVSLFPDIETFRNVLNGYLRTATVIKEETEVIIDTEISFKDITQKLLKDIRILPSDKEAWPDPMFIIKGLRVASIKYSNNNRNNICFSLVDSDRILLDFWGWNVSNIYDSIGRPEMIDIIGRITNVGYGRNSDNATFEIRDLRKSEIS